MFFYFELFLKNIPDIISVCQEQLIFVSLFIIVTLHIAALEWSISFYWCWHIFTSYLLSYFLNLLGDCPCFISYVHVSFMGSSSLTYLNFIILKGWIRVVWVAFHKLNLSFQSELSLTSIPDTAASE